MTSGISGTSGDATDLGSFDFVIVGAGSSGCALAEGLSRSGKYRVALLEAGGSDRHFYVQMPLGYGKTFYDRSLNWGYESEPDPGLGGQRDYWPRGKVLGGSSSINAMVWIRGDAADYDGWAAEGNPGWSYADVLPFFKALEDNEAGEDQWRGQGGPVHITDPSARMHPLARRFIEAGQQAGFAFNPDFNGRTQEGVGCYKINTRRGWRHSASKAFLRPARKRSNLAVFTKAQATRLMIADGRVTGVALLHKGRPATIRAKGEVILSAGAVNTPHLLQVSGIGRAEDLARAGISTRLESPAVGHFLQDHLGINYIYRSKIPSLNSALRPWWGKLLAGIEFLAFQTGPLSLSLNQGGGFVRSSPERPLPNVQLYLQAISTFTGKKGTRPLLTPDPFPGFNLGLSNCRPRARGHIVARSSDPLAAPAIFANAFGDPADEQEMLESVKLLRHIARQPALAEIIAEELAPGPAVETDEALIADFRKRSGTVYHPCGTVRMGDARARAEGRAALDHRLRFHGLDGLRVADASVFPSVISGNTNAPAMMVGLKAAAMILEDHA